MTELELLDMFIHESINMLIDIIQKSQPEESKMEEDRILQAEIFIVNLPSQEKELVEDYIDSLMNQLALKEHFLYMHGFIDGIKVLKYIDEF